MEAVVAPEQFVEWTKLILRPSAVPDHYKHDLSNLERGIKVFVEFGEVGGEHSSTERGYIARWRCLARSCRHCRNGKSARKSRTGRRCRKGRVVRRQGGRVAGSAGVGGVAGIAKVAKPESRTRSSTSR